MPVKYGQMMINKLRDPLIQKINCNVNYLFVKFCEIMKVR